MTVYFCKRIFPIIFSQLLNGNYVEKLISPTKIFFCFFSVVPPKIITAQMIQNIDMLL
jgi:hypothetical protein